MRGELIYPCEALPVFAKNRGSPDRDRGVNPTEMRARLACLTSRERQVMKLLVTGLKSREMAQQLGISARTIDVHRAHIMLKMGTKRVPELVRWALSFGP